MADTMGFPNTMKEFIDIFSFKDSEEIYTNGTELIPVFRVEQALEHYTKEKRNNAIDEFAERIKQGDVIEYMGSYVSYEAIVSFIDEIAEQMKGGVK